MAKYTAKKLEEFIGKKVVVTFKNTCPPCNFQNGIYVGIFHKAINKYFKEDKFGGICTLHRKGYGVYLMHSTPEGETLRQTLCFLIKNIKSIEEASADIRTVFIPSKSEHEGWWGQYVNLRWICPKCGKPRGNIKRVLSYDGSLPLHCDGWDNDCGHIDRYKDCLLEAASNGLN